MTFGISSSTDVAVLAGRSLPALPSHSTMTLAFILSLPVLLTTVYWFFIYPFYVSPLRHLPGPKVSLSPSSIVSFSLRLLLLVFCRVRQELAIHKDGTLVLLPAHWGKCLSFLSSMFLPARVSSPATLGPFLASGGPCQCPAACFETSTVRCATAACHQTCTHDRPKL